ncbi:MAG: tetratricopeptide repeat protein [Proteobacteria bacterium]|nr:tetratricopeptide repeat protein [Pseudomonadota bacterium]
MRDLFKQAQELQRQGNLSDALGIYKQLHEEDPGNPDFSHQIGIIYAQLQDWANALDYVNKALKIAPFSAQYHNSKGNIFSLQGNQAAALDEYRKAVKADHRYAIAYNNIGRCLYLQEKFVAAQKSYAKAIELNSNYSDAYYNQGVLLLKLGDLTNAEQSLEKALSLNLKNPAVFGQIAQIYLQQANYPQSIKYLQQRLALQPDHVDSWHYLGVAYFVIEHYQEAKNSFEQVLQITHQHPECYEHLAMVYLKLDDKEKALTYFLRQLEVQASANAAYNAGVLLSEKGRHRDAIEYFKYTITLEPMHLPAHLNLGVEYLKLQQPQQALPHYQQAAAIKPDDPEIQHILLALNQQQIPDRAPAEYLKNLFDQYAAYYDQHLTESLHYRVPQLLHAAIVDLIDIEQAQWVILDLGCGTGLTGELFREFAVKLIGIDISGEMITAAKQKHVYDQLHVADIEKALDDYRDISLVLAADVFTYIGKLDQIFNKVKVALKTTGLFAFSVEKSSDKQYELLPSIRYAHSRHYLENLAKQNHFEIIRFEETTIRLQKGQPIIGYVVVLKKSKDLR